MDYLPDVILRMVQLGFRDRVLNSSTIWICASCETCTTRCPNEIDIAGVIDTLRRMALSEGRVAPAVKDIPKFHQAFLSSIKAGGRVNEVGMLRRYLLKTNLWAKLRSGELLEQAKLGWGMFRRGKLKIWPHRIRQAGEIKKLFAKSGR
jgi:heterodisulfide reductase subunit C